VNVLITSASRKVSLVRAFQSALARRGGGHVIAVDTNPCAPALYVADRHFLVSPSTEPHFIEEIAQLCQRERVGLIVPTRDEELLRFAEAREKLEQCGLWVMVPAAETVRLCQDKLAFVAFCRTHEFGTPCTYEADEWRSGGFPLFVKPRFGKGSRGARLVYDETELQQATRNQEEWVIQEYVEEPEYTVDLLADFNSRVLSVVPRLRQVVIAGESYVSRTVNEPELIKESARLARKLSLVGHNTIQCFWNGEQAKFVEVNPRFGGAAALGIAAGVDTPAMLLRLLDGEALPEGFGEFESDLTMLRFTEDLFLKASALNASVLNAGAFTSSASDVVATIGPPAQDGGNANLRAVLFDLDNTLYPEEQFVASGFRAVANCLAEHTNLAAEALEKKMWHILHTQGRGRVFNTLLAELKLDSRVWLRTLLLVYRSHQASISLFPGIGEALVALKDQGLRLGLVTDGPGSVQRRKIAALDLERHMDVIVCTDELGAGYAKPSTVPFEVATTLLGVAASETAYLGDDISKDFAGPNRLGMKSMQVGLSRLVGVRRSPISDDPLFRPQLQAGSLADALKMLKLL
jgi:carbamoyl-phosphate synthase large subunit